MNHEKSQKIFGRLKQNQENLEQFRRTNFEELKAKGLFDFYLNKLSNKTICLEESFEFLTHQNYFALKFKNESLFNPEFMKFEMTPEMVMLYFWNIDRVDSEVKKLLNNLYYFYVKHIVNHFTFKGTPRIKLSIPNNFEIVDFKQLYVKDYEIEEYVDDSKHRDKDCNEYILTHKTAKTDCYATGDDVLHITQNLFGEEHIFNNNNWDKATTTTFSNGVIGFEKDRLFINQLTICSSSSTLEKIANELGVRILGDKYWIPISENKKDWQEEIEFLSALTYENIYQSKENLNQLSPEIINLMRQFLKFRFHDVRRLPMMGGSQLHASIVNHLTSGDWKEKDNYKSKLMKWMTSLKVIDSNAFGMILYYDGSLKGLSETAFLLLPFSNTERILKLKCSNYIFHSESEALDELRSKNQLLIEYWNRKI